MFIEYKIIQVCNDLSVEILTHTNSNKKSFMEMEEYEVHTVLLG